MNQVIDCINDGKPCPYVRLKQIFHTTLTGYLLQFCLLYTSKTNLVRQKLVDSGFGGGVFSVDYKNEKLNASLGGGLNRYSNDHYGKVIWVKNYTEALNPDHEYYRNNGSKTDGNIYVKANYQIAGGLHAYADLQYRYINYKITGDNDKWDWTAEPGHLQRLNVNEHFSFFNPKAGLF